MKDRMASTKIVVELLLDHPVLPLVRKKLPVLSPVAVIPQVTQSNMGCVPSPYFWTIERQ